ncbi:MAG: ClpXP protease specificity-enhancing factor [Azoarcus sp.]|nr:ClpXP protease specificity-enhancing factor [Azoarcus sp.]
MVSTKPYLVRAIYEWCVDQGFTPYVAARVDANTRVPPGYAKDGQIVLNVASDATNQLSMDNEMVSFQARFNGAVHHIVIPMANVSAVYARENGHGMAFEPELVGEDELDGDAAGEDTPEGRSEGTPSATPEVDAPPPRGSHLKIVK